MGTHPIFESDFDCLTEMSGRLVRLVIRRRLGSTVRNCSQETWRQLLDQADPSQKQFFDEPLILVDEGDLIHGQISKVEAHLKCGVGGVAPLHRAFSLFHFDQSKRLLLQKRSEVKVTFPGLWTNSCCSHPLYNLSEMDGKEGAIKAAVRRARFECGLGLKRSEMTHVTRVLYAADCSDQLAENELDHCIISRSNAEVNHNCYEISQIKWLSESDLSSFVASEEVTPWFRLIVESGLLSHWWTHLSDLKSIANDEIVKL